MAVVTLHSGEVCIGPYIPKPYQPKATYVTYGIYGIEIDDDQFAYLNTPALLRQIFTQQWNIPPGALCLVNGNPWPEYQPIKQRSRVEFHRG